MNPKFRKPALIVSLAVIALFVFGAFQVLAAFSDGCPQLASSSSSAISTRSDDSVQGSETEKAEDFSFTGKIEAINGTVFTINGMAVSVDASTRLDGSLAVGVEVKVEVVKQVDGSLLAKEIEASAANEPETELNDLNDDHGSDLDLNDDHGSDIQMSDDHGAQVEPMDDQGQDMLKVDDHSGISTNSANLSQGTARPEDGAKSSGQVEDRGGHSGKGRD